MSLPRHSLDVSSKTWDFPGKLFQAGAGPLLGGSLEHAMSFMEVL